MPAESLKDFIVRRREELDLLEGPLVEKLNALRQEREQLKRAALASGIENYTDPAQERTRLQKRLGKVTIKEAVVGVLEEHASGLPALDILREINQRHETDYVRESLSPQLSRLKNDGHIELTGRLWHLRGQTPIPKEEPDPSLFTEDGSGDSETKPAEDRGAGSGGGT